MSKGDEHNAPSAPTEDEHQVTSPPTTQPPYPTSTTASHPTPSSQQSPQQPPQQLYPSANATYGTNTESVDYSEAPPSYQDAMNYPQINYGQVGAASQHPAMPKPFTPQTTVPVHGAYPGANATSPVIITQPLGAPPPHPGMTQQPTVVHTVIQTATTGNTCAWCRSGIIRNETDLCCLICLIILAICTFPFGLILLCCIPCTVRPRCSHCRRLQD